MGKTRAGILNLDWYEALHLYEIGALSIDLDAVYRELKGLGYFVMAPLSCHACPKNEIVCGSRIESLLGFGRLGLSFDFQRDGLAVWTMSDTEIYRRIRIVPRTALVKERVAGMEDIVDFNVFIPRKKFKKSIPGVADFRVIIKKANEGVFELKELQMLFDESGGEVKLAIVENEMVSFLSLNAVVHPQEHVK
jgi:hypothetical protein